MEACNWKSILCGSTRAVEARSRPRSQVDFMDSSIRFSCSDQPIFLILNDCSAITLPHFISLNYGFQIWNLNGLTTPWEIHYGFYWSSRAHDTILQSVFPLFSRLVRRSLVRLVGSPLSLSSVTAQLLPDNLCPNGRIYFFRVHPALFFRSLDITGKRPNEVKSVNS